MIESEWLTSTEPAALLENLTVGRWDAFPDPNFKVGDRKLRLFACACCRTVWPLLTDPRSRRAVEVAERYADGEVAQAELSIAHDAAHEAWSWSPQSNPAGLARYAALENVSYAAERIVRASGKDGVPSPAAQAALLREIVGNPFRPVTLPAAEYLRYDGVEIRSTPILSRHAYAVPPVLALARTAYAERRQDGALDPDTLAVLADALEEAGCTDAGLLRHLRRPVRCAACAEWPCPGHLRQGAGIRQVLVACPFCHGEFGNHVCGCWALDLLLGKE